MHGSRAAVAAMREDGGGHILNIASMSSFGPVPGLAVYAATKAAVLSFSAGLQGDLDLAGIPIRVHVLCPDAADTAMVQTRGSSRTRRSCSPERRCLIRARSPTPPSSCSTGGGSSSTMPAYRAAMVRGRRARADRRAEGVGLLRRLGERRRVAA